MVHLSNKAAEICALLQKQGFKPTSDPEARAVYVAAHFESMEQDREMITGADADGKPILDSDGEPTYTPEMTFEEFAIRLRDYACFTIEPDLYSLVPDIPFADTDTIYADIEFNFWNDFNAYLRKELGDDVSITHHGKHGGCSEFEVIREVKAASV